MSDVLEICCDDPKLPEGIYVYGFNAVARCHNCAYVCVYWECACELAHACN